MTWQTTNLLVEAQSIVQSPSDYIQRAKTWLEDQYDIDAVVRYRATATQCQSVILEHEMAIDARYASMEVVRRAERRIGQLLRDGQERGLIYKKGDNLHEQRVGVRTVQDAAGVRNRSEIDAYYALAKVSQEEFDQAIEKSRAEGNLARASLVRLVKGQTLEPRVSKPKINSNRIVEGLSLELDAMTTGLDLIEPQDLDVEQKGEWIKSIQHSIRTIQREIRKW